MIVCVCKRVQGSTVVCMSVCQKGKGERASRRNEARQPMKKAKSTGQVLSLAKV